MNIWNKIVLGTKFLFGGFESATDYLLKLLNELLAKGKVPERVQEIRSFVVTVLSYMKKYEKYCPAIWAPHFEKLEEAMQTLIDVFEDGQLTAEEAEKAVEALKAAIKAWMK